MANAEFSRVPGCDGAGKAERSYSTFKVGRGGGEQIPLIQGKEQRLHLLEQP